MDVHGYVLIMKEVYKERNAIIRYNIITKLTLIIYIQTSGVRN